MNTPSPGNFEGPNALIAAFEMHRGRLRDMVARRMDPALFARTDPDDILSETFLQAQRKWPTRDSAAMSVYAWLYRIALDCLIEAWRRETRDKRDLRRDLPWPERSSMQLGLHFGNRGTSPSSAAARNDQQEQVLNLLDLLDDRDREILWLRHFDQLSFKEIAAIHGITETNANVRFGRALRRFKRLWQAARRPE